MSHSDTQVIVYDGGSIKNYLLNDWLEDFDHVIRISEFMKPFPDLVALGRNNSLAWFRDRTNLPQVLLLDDDIVPNERTEEIFHTDADIIGATYLNHEGQRTHQGESQVAAGCMLIKRRVVETLDSPWFEFVTSASGLVLKQCECQFMCNKAVKCGFSVVSAGTAGQLSLVLVEPPAHAGAPVRMKYWETLLKERVAEKY